MSYPDYALDLQFRMILICNRKKSYKPQASSLTAGPGDDRMDLERNNYGHNTIKKNSRCFRRDPEVSKTRYEKV